MIHLDYRVAMVRSPKIFITGGAGTGKTTLAGRLAERLGLPFVELDPVMWKYDGSGGAESLENRLRSVNEIVRRPGWVTEGSYVGPAQEIWRRADLIVFIEASIRTALWRIFWRHLRAEVSRNNRHQGWIKLFRFMKIVADCNRSPHVGDLGSEHDEPKLTLARLVAKREQYKEKVLIVGDSPDIDEILTVIDSI